MKHDNILHASVITLVASLVCALLGFAGVDTALGLFIIGVLARLLFFVFVLIAVVTFLITLFRSE